MPFIEHESRQITDKKEIVSAFNEHFVNVGYSLAEKVEDKSTDDPTQFLHVIDKSARFLFLFSILLFIHGSPSGKRPDLQGAMLKKKKQSDLAIYSKRNAIVTTNGIKK